MKAKAAQNSKGFFYSGVRPGWHAVQLLRLGTCVAPFEDRQKNEEGCGCEISPLQTLCELDKQLFESRSQSP